MTQVRMRRSWGRKPSLLTATRLHLRRRSRPAPGTSTSASSPTSLKELPFQGPTPCLSPCLEHVLHASSQAKRLQPEP